MNIYVIGLPKAGRTTVAKAVSSNLGYVYLSASDWILKTFRQPKPDEHEQSYKDEYQKYFFDRLRLNPNICIENIVDTISCHKDSNFVIDGISSPRDFINLFDINRDIVVILNRTDNDAYHQDHDSIFISTIKDYCFWMASAELINKQRWLEFNFKLNSKESTNEIKYMGTKNTVCLAKSINAVINNLQDKLFNMTSISTI